MLSEKTIDHDVLTACNSKTYTKRICNDNIYITVAYRNDNPQRVDYIKIVGSSKHNPCGASFLDCLADNATFMIRRIRNKHEAEAIVKNHRFHKCQQIIANKDHTTSCADALGQVLQEVLLEVSEQNI
jgi:hypothetical protein